MSDLVINVRQIGSYGELFQSNGQELVLVQSGGLGTSYQNMTTATLVATALNRGPAMGVGAVPPANAEGNQLFVGALNLPPVSQILWDAYIVRGDGEVSWTGGQAASFGWQASAGWNWATAPVSPGSLQWFNLMVLNPTGNLALPLGTLSVARDPAAANEVATARWVGNNTVHSFNNRIGQVTLDSNDVYSALRLCDPIATQPWVQNAIDNSIHNLLVTCPFVNRWNGRTGSVYLMLSDITTVFYQPGQQPISPTPILTSNDDSIATTRWVTEHPPALTASAPPLNPTSGQLWWNDVDGNLYVYYQDPTSAQWVSAMADGGGGGSGSGFLPLSGGTMPGPLNVTATGSTASRSVQDRFAEVINVKDFGAKGDGQDDTAAIQAALNAITADGAAVYFPTGTYALTSTLVIPATGLSPNGVWSGIKLYGDGSGFTRFVHNLISAPFMTCTMAPGTAAFNLTIQDMLFQTYSVVFNAWHIDIQNVHAFTLRRCDLHSQNADPAAIAGVRVRAVGGGTIFYTRIEDSTIIGGTVELDTITDSWITGSILQGINAGETGSRASSIHLTGATSGDIKILGNHIYSTNSGGILCDATEHAIMLVANNMFDTNPPNPATAIAIRILAGGTTWAICDNVFNAIPATTIQCWDLSDSTISNNTFIGCGTGSGNAPTITFNATATGCSSVTVANNAARNDSSLATPLYFVQENAFGGNSCTYLANQVGGIGYQAVPYHVVPGSSYPPGLFLPTGLYVTPPTGFPSVSFGGNWNGAIPGVFSGGQIGWNLSSGQAEVDFVNCNTNAPHSFEFHQVTGAGTHQSLATVTMTGVTSAGQLQISGLGGPTWTTGAAAPTSTQPVGSLYSQLGGAVGATLYVSRGGGTWAAVAGV